MARAVVWSQSVVPAGTISFNPSPGATYYIDYFGGSDSNSGKTSLFPWKHCPGDTRATGNALAAASTLVAGTIIAFKGGVTYTGSGTGTLLAPTKSGSSIGGYIRFQGNVQDGTWGNGAAIIDLNSTYSRFFNGNNINYIWIDNFDISNMSNQASSVGAVAGTPGPTCANDYWAVTRNGVDICATYTGSGDIANSGAIRANGNCSNWVVNNCIFHEPQNWGDLSAIGSATNFATNGSLTPSVPCQVRHIIFTGVISKMIVQNCEFYACGQDCIVLLGTDKVTITGNNFGGVNRGSQFTGYFSVAIRAEASGTASSANTNLLIYNNTFHEGWQYEGDASQGRSHAGDWIHIYNGHTATLNGPTYIKQNFFYNDQLFANFGGTGMVFIEDAGTTLQIFDNIAVNPHAAIGFGGGGTGFSDLNIDSNTIVMYLPFAALGIATASTSNFRNNIFIHFGSTGGSVCNSDTIGNTGGGALPAICNNNVYYTPNGATVWKFGATFYNFANWKTFSSLDGNSVSTDPQLASLPTQSGGNWVGGLLPSQGNYNITASSPAHNGGLTISYFNYDFIGTTRPQGVAWDIGAYELIP